MRVDDTFPIRLVEMPDYDGAKNQERMTSILAGPAAAAPGAQYRRRQNLDRRVEAKGAALGTRQRLAFGNHL